MKSTRKKYILLALMLSLVSGLLYDGMLNELDVCASVIVENEMDEDVQTTFRECSIGQVDYLPFTEAGNEQIQVFNGFIQYPSLYSFKFHYLYKVLIDNQLSLNKVDNSISFYVENNAYKKLEGYYLFILHKLLI